MSFYEEVYYELLKNLISAKKQVRLDAFNQLQEFYRQRLADADLNGSYVADGFDELVKSMKTSQAGSVWFLKKQGQQEKELLEYE